MNNFEKWQPAPPEIPPRGQEAFQRLDADVKGWRSRYLLPIIAAASLTTGLGVAAARTTMGGEAGVRSAATSPEAVPEKTEAREEPAIPEEESVFGVKVNYAELQRLDPEARPERVKAFLTTIPPELLENVSAIRFSDEQRVSKMGEGWTVIATAFGGEGEEKTPIFCWSEAKRISSKELWTVYMIHEIFHANDWRTLEWYDKGAAEKLHAALKQRVRAKDRFISSYVESIHDEDKKYELEDKALEYWAEIGEAYLSGRPLSEADAKLVKDFLAIVAPGFDRDAALKARDAQLDDMEGEEASKEYETLPQQERASIDAWMKRRSGLDESSADLLLQREGRREILVAFQSGFARLGQTNEARDYLKVLTNYYGAQENLFEARAGGDPLKATVALGRVALAFEDLEIVAASFPDSDAVRQEIEGVMDRYSVWIGGETHPMRMETDEYGTWTATQQNFWRAMSFNWDVPQDPLDQYLNQRSFEAPEEEPGKDDGAEDEGIEITS